MRASSGLAERQMSRYGDQAILTRSSTAAAIDRHDGVYVYGHQRQGNSGRASRTRCDTRGAGRSRDATTPEPIGAAHDTVYFAVSQWPQLRHGLANK